MTGTVIEDYIRTSEVAFCLSDFDCAVQLPPGISLKDYRLPSIEGTIGTPMYHPADLHLAERDYNPFAFDVGCLGMLFLYHFTVSLDD